VININTNIAILIFYFLLLFGIFFAGIRLRIMALTIKNILEESKKKTRFMVYLKLSDKMRYLEYFKDKKNSYNNKTELANYIKKKSIEYRLCRGYLTFTLVVGLLTMLLFLSSLLYVLLGKK